MSQVNVIVIHVRADQAKEYEALFEQRQLPRWRDYHARRKFLSARFFRSQFGSDEPRKVAKYVIVVEVPSMVDHSVHDADPDIQEFAQLAAAVQPDGHLV